MPWGIRNCALGEKDSAKNADDVNSSHNIENASNILDFPENWAKKKLMNKHVIGNWSYHLPY